MERCQLLSSVIAKIDRLINTQVNCILHAPDFQELEASWRGVHWLVQTLKGSRKVKIRVLSVTLAEIARDIAHAIEFDQTFLFQKIYSAEYDMAGGEPFGLLLADFYFYHQLNARLSATEILSSLAQVAAAAFAPLITGVDPKLFGIDAMAELKPTTPLQTILKQKQYARWQQFRQSSDARFLGLALPRVLLRRPYNFQGKKIAHRFFKEIVLAANDYVWGNACYGYGVIAIENFLKTGWFDGMRGQSKTNAEPGAVFVSQVRQKILGDYDSCWQQLNSEIGRASCRERV